MMIVGELVGHLVGGHGDPGQLGADQLGNARSARLIATVTLCLAACRAPRLPDATRRGAQRSALTSALKIGGLGPVRGARSASRGWPLPGQQEPSENPAIGGDFSGLRGGRTG